jgi:hypothetical protein
MAGMTPKYQPARFKNPPTPKAGFEPCMEKNVSADQKRSGNIGVNARGGAPTRPADTAGADTGGARTS